jgi:hypothetical protein
MWDDGDNERNAPWWPAVAAVAVVPSLILLGIVLAALGASDALVVGVIVGPLLVAGLAALLVALGAIAYMPYAVWKESRERRPPRTTVVVRPSIRPEPRPSD